jgi:hypothetical protein
MRLPKYPTKVNLPGPGLLHLDSAYADGTGALPDPDHRVDSRRCVRRDRDRQLAGSFDLRGGSAK